MVLTLQGIPSITIYSEKHGRKIHASESDSGLRKLSSHVRRPLNVFVRIFKMNYNDPFHFHPKIMLKTMGRRRLGIST